MKRFLSFFSSAYFRLGRFHTTAGLWVSSVIPPLTGMVFAKPSIPMMLFLSLVIILGGMCIRAAACTINDMCDVDIDKQVKRTKKRPIASGELSEKEGLFGFVMFCIPPLVILLFTNVTTIYLSIVAAFLIVLYPLAKRVLRVPQIFLGLTSGMGVFIGYAMVTGAISISVVMLYIGFVFWTVAFDTIYAYQDVEDDAKVGVNSSAIYYGKSAKNRIKAFFFTSVMFWLSSGVLASMGIGFFIVLAIIALMFFVQYRVVNLDNPASCAAMFRMSVLIGFMLTLAVFLGAYF